MPTWTALTTIPDEAPAQALGLALEALDPAPTAIGVFEIEDGSGLWEVGGFFTEHPDIAALSLLAAAHGAKDFAVSRVEDRDWVAQVQRELSPVEAGRFFVHGAHDADRVPRNAIPLRIEAAMAFGTGHHGTTKGCLLSMERLAIAGLTAKRTADIGCGTGVLAMGAAALWRNLVIATDIDPVAVATARENARANGFSPWIRTGRAAGLRSPLLAQAVPFDLILANILAKPLKRMAPEIAGAIAPGGVAILSGLLTWQAPGVEAVYAGFGFRREHRLTLGEWTTLTLRRW